MEYVLSNTDIGMIKADLRIRVPEAKSSHRAEAMARGLGFNTYSALKARIDCGPVPCKVSEANFASFLREKGCSKIPPDALGRIVRELVGMTTIARRERLSCLPDTLEEALEILENPKGDNDYEEWAAALDATESCDLCGTTIIQPDIFAENLVEHYEPDGDSWKIVEQIEAAVTLNAPETGRDGEGGTICSHCAHIMDKDD